MTTENKWIKNHTTASFNETRKKLELLTAKLWQNQYYSRVKRNKHRWVNKHNKIQLHQTGASKSCKPSYPHLVFHWFFSDDEPQFPCFFKGFWK